MQTILIHFAIFFVFYIIGAYATTDILRLLKGCSTSINAPDCYCPSCHCKISLRDQLPIVSYIKNHGACYHCKSPIPFSDLFLEIFLFLSLSGISFVLNYSWLAYFICLLFYELTKVAFLCRYGRREINFAKNLFLSIRNNLIIFSLVALLFLLANII